MPRDSYYQDVGNPVRRELLPDEPLETALPLKEESTEERGAGILKILFLVFLVDLADAFVVGLSDAEILLQLRGYGIVGVSLLLLFYFSYLSHDWRARSTIAIVGALTTYSVATTSLSFAHWIHAAAAAACYIWWFTRHWIDRCLTSPVEKESSKRLKAEWSGLLLLSASVPLVLVGVAIVFTPVVAGCVGGILALVIFSASVVTVLRDWKRVRHSVATAALSSWLTYNMLRQDLPGTFKSPAGSAAIRASVTVATSFVVAATARELFQFPLVPSILTAVSPCLTSRLILAASNEHREDEVTPELWQGFVRSIRKSENIDEKQSYYMGRVAKDGSVVLVPRSIFNEHAHFLGDSGSGKTSLGFLPFIEQTIAFGDASLVVIDLKADTLELLATMVKAKELVETERRDDGERDFELPLKYISTRDDFSSFAFNPQMQGFFELFNAYKKTDLVTGATDLDYGTGYGPAFFSAANASVLHQTYEAFPDVRTFAELAERCSYVLNDTKNSKLAPEMRKNGAHVAEVLSRLGSFAPMNVTPDSDLPDDVIEQAIDLADVFRRPQLLYLHLSSTLSPGTAPALARFVTFFLLASATTQTERVPVYLVIDEFQRMVSGNFAYMLQLARSMGVGMILANQSMEDLKTSTTDLIPTVEANCRYREWYSVSSSADVERLIQSSGHAVEQFSTVTTRATNDGNVQSKSLAERVVPRLDTNDIALASDHPKHSIVRVSRGEGYAQFGGLPFICETGYHITRDEYNDRKQFKWPHRQYGTFIPDEWADQVNDAKPSGPTFTTEVVGPNGGPVNNDPFEEFLRDLPPEDLSSDPNNSSCDNNSGEGRNNRKRRRRYK